MTESKTPDHVTDARENAGRQVEGEKFFPAIACLQLSSRQPEQVHVHQNMKHVLLCMQEVVRRQPPDLPTDYECRSEFEQPLHGRIAVAIGPRNGEEL